MSRPILSLSLQSKLSTVARAGTLAARSGVRPTEDFAFELEDPVLGRKIAHACRVIALPVLG